MRYIGREYNASGIPNSPRRKQIARKVIGIFHLRKQDDYKLFMFAVLSPQEHLLYLTKRRRPIDQSSQILRLGVARSDKHWTLFNGLASGRQRSIRALIDLGQCKYSWRRSSASMPWSEGPDGIRKRLSVILGIDF
ncbi:hypothetical protein ElyMa_000126600 [Elysia marginata]|uniref:Uncharacterized protein n=1 Tax=Elysia marginata TaxID=1093978 RepID=A0AAV4ENN6_9GAST|nr:hypothetical protein ElyMa_000126600 [Elysia marginata]